MLQEFRVRNLTSTDREEWEHLLSASQESTPFHSYEWGEALRLSFPDEASIYWGLWMDEELIAVWPTSLMPILGGRVLNPRYLHSDYFAATPAMKDGVEMNVLRQLSSYIARFVKQRYQVLFWSLRVPESCPFVEASPFCGFKIRPGLARTQCSIMLRTSESLEILWKKFPYGGLRTCVKNAGREGLEVRESSDLCDLKGYFDVKMKTYSELIKTKQLTTEDLLNENWPFWVLIHRLLMSRGKAKLFVTRHQDRIIAGAIIFFQNNKAYLWNMGSLTSTWRMHPNHILIWNIIKWAYKSGINSIDFGTVTRTGGVHYFVERNLTNYQQVDHIMLTLPINKFLYQFQTSLETAFRTLHPWAPHVLNRWYTRRVSGIS
jgi:hypothetical protein